MCWEDRHKAGLPFFVISTLILFTLLNAASPLLGFWAAIALFMVGVPHGAVERNYFKPKHEKSLRPSLAYTAIYLVIGILIFCSWLISPLATLVVFLLLSAYHFGQSESHEAGKFVKYLIGTWAVFGTFLVYPNETMDAFHLMTGANILTASTPFPLAELGQGLAFVIFAALILCAVRDVKRRGLDQLLLLRLISLVAVFIILPPVPAVAVYYFLFHSLREMALTMDAMPARKSNIKTYLALYAPASAPALTGGTGIIILAALGYIPLTTAAGLAIAFAMPHMMMLEKLVQADFKLSDDVKI